MHGHRRHGGQRGTRSEPRDKPTTDVIESGPSPRGLAARRLAALVAVMALGAWLVYLERTPPPSAPATTTAVEVMTIAPPTIDPNLPTAIVADQLPAGIDLGTVVVPTRPPRLVDTVSGTSQPIVGVPDGAGTAYEVYDLGGGHFLVTVREPRGDTQAFLVTSPDAAAVPVAAGDSVVVGADNTSILVTRTDQAGQRSVQRYDLAGTAVGAPVPTVADEFLDEETVAGWLFVYWDGWRLRDPVTGEERAQYRYLLAAEPTTLAYAAADGGLTAITLAGDARDAVKVHTSPPPVVNVFAARFSPGAHYLAVHGADSTVTAHTVLVLDLATGRWTALPGTPARLGPEGRALSMAWAGDVLAVVTPDGDAVLWRPTDPAAYAVPE